METYYRHSGRFWPIGILLTLALGLVAGSFLGLAYDYGLMYISAEKLRVCTTAGFGMLMGFSVGYAMRWGRIRNLPLAFILAAALSLLAWYISWGLWFKIALAMDGHSFDLLAYLARPGAMWEIVKRLNQIGSFTEQGRPVTGNELWGIWGLEALFIIGLGAAIGYKTIRSAAFCERCERWCESFKKIGCKPADAALVKTQLESGDFSFFQTSALPDGATLWIFELFACKSCRGLYTLTWKQNTRRTRKVFRVFKNTKQDIKTVLEQLLVSPENVSRMEAGEERMLRSASGAAAAGA